MARPFTRRAGMSQKKPRRNVNISPGNWVADAFKYIGGGLLVAVSLFVICGLLVDFVVPHISFETEQRLFNLLGDKGVFEDKRMPGKERPIQDLLDRLVDSCSAMEHPVTVEVVKSNMVNAFAFPGGRIVIMSGLLDKMGSENELTFILGHELGHMANRDHLRGFGRGLILVALSTAVEQATGVSLISDPLALTNLVFSRKQETDADRYGIDALNCFYGHTSGAPDFFATLDAEQDQEDWKEYLSSHPDNDKRIARLKEYRAKKGYGIGERTPMNLY